MISLVVPVYNEADNIGPFLREVEAAVHEPHEILIVYDFPEDRTLPAVAALDPPAPSVRLVQNTPRPRAPNTPKARLLASKRDRVIALMAPRSPEPGAAPPPAPLRRRG